MCFKNLPIEFDANGKARLKDGGDPWAVRPEHDPFAELRQLAPDAAPRGDSRRVLTQVDGAHAFHTLVVRGRSRR